MGASRLEFRTLHQWASSQAARSGQLLEWVVEHLCQPHEDLGRPGPVCPFTHKALTRNLIEVAVVPEHVRSIEAIVHLAHGEASAFLQRHGLCPSEQPSAIMVFRHFSAADCRHLLLPAHRAAKPLVVSQGLMLGEFFPGHDLPGVRNPQFPAGEAPMPLLVIRRMVRQDADFLRSEPAHVFASYQRRFGTDVTSSTAG